jgi:nitrous oxide reductase
MAHEEQYGDEVVAQNGISRRKMIATGATLAAAGVAVGAVGMGVVAPGAPNAPAASGAPGAGDPMMVYLKNAESGQFDVFVGERHASFANRDMAAQVIDAANRAD